MTQSIVTPTLARALGDTKQRNIRFTRACGSQLNNLRFGLSAFTASTRRPLSRRTMYFGNQSHSRPSWSSDYHPQVPSGGGAVFIFPRRLPAFNNRLKSERSKGSTKYILTEKSWPSRRSRPACGDRSRSIWVASLLRRAKRLSSSESSIRWAHQRFSNRILVVSEVVPEKVFGRCRWST